MGFGVVVGLLAVAVAGIVVVANMASHALSRRELGNRVDQLTLDLTTWRLNNVDRIVILAKQMTRVEKAVARAEDEARRASLAVDELGRHLLTRMEAIEQDQEIDILVAQGRIPREHRRPPEHRW